MSDEAVPACPFCHMNLAADADVCRGCGALRVAGLSRRKRRLVFLAAFMAVAAFAGMLAANLGAALVVGAVVALVLVGISNALAPRRWIPRMRNIGWLPQIHE